MVTRSLIEILRMADLEDRALQEDQRRRGVTDLGKDCWPGEESNCLGRKEAHATKVIMTGKNNALAENCAAVGCRERIVFVRSVFRRESEV